MDVAQCWDVGNVGGGAGTYLAFKLAQFAKDEMLYGLPAGKQQHVRHVGQHLHPASEGVISDSE